MVRRAATGGDHGGQHGYCQFLRGIHHFVLGAALNYKFMLPAGLPGSNKGYRMIA
jgi:hypothetical protein